MKRHFRVVSSSRAFNGARAATVTIDNGSVQPDTFPLVSVRPLRQRRTYELPLAHLARLVVEKVIKSEVAARRPPTKRRFLPRRSVL